ncbi:dTDP-4-dehydrorhamnose reductase [Nocardia sp. 004]|uniref:dTDP-4-dehydrorhamnose reductase n=1 Tax=Nocardia sp. 004 TaxID=3385978 RepID=UPI0039A0B670
MTDRTAPEPTVSARLVVTGAYGQVGRELLRLVPAANGYGHTELDITDPAAVRSVLAPGDVVLNCAAYTAVDQAETEIEAAYAGNATGPAVLAEACADLGARLIHLSTDYVFPGTPGTHDRPYDTADPTGPASIYGKSKLAGEQEVLARCPDAHVVRTAWVYTGHGSDFVATMLRLERERDTIDVVDDEIGSPTYAADLAAALVELTRRPDAPRLLHATNAGQASRFELARAAFTEVGADPDRIRPCRSAAFPRPAPRPGYSVLSPRTWDNAELTPLRNWRTALGDALARRSG